VTSAHLQSILGGMVGVTTEDTGTATPAFQGFAWQVAGKTGTAEALHSYMVASSTQTTTAVWIGNIEGDQNMRRISIGGILASNLRTYLMKPILASLNASAVYGAGGTFTEPTGTLLRGTTYRAQIPSPSPAPTPSPPPAPTTGPGSGPGNGNGGGHRKP